MRPVWLFKIQFMWYIWRLKREISNSDVFISFIYQQNASLLFVFFVIFIDTRHMKKNHVCLHASYMHLYFHLQIRYPATFKVNPRDHDNQNHQKVTLNKRKNLNKSI